MGIITGRRGIEAHLERIWSAFEAHLKRIWNGKKVWFYYFNLLLDEVHNDLSDQIRAPDRDV